MTENSLDLLYKNLQLPTLNFAPSLVHGRAPLEGWMPQFVKHLTKASEMRNPLWLLFLDVSSIALAVAYNILSVYDMQKFGKFGNPELSELLLPTEIFMQPDVEIFRLDQILVLWISSIFKTFLFKCA